MPLRVHLLLEADLLAAGVGVGNSQVLELLRADGANLGIITSQLEAVVQERVDVQGRRLGPAGELTQAQDELLLKVVGELVLGTEEYDTTLGDLIVERILSAGQTAVSSPTPDAQMARGRWHLLTGYGQVSDQLI